MRINLLSLLALCSLSVLPACDDGHDDGDDGDSGNSSNNGDAGCDAPITECPLGELSEEQQATYCDTLTAAIDDGPGTRYTCDADGVFLEVTSSEDCRANKVSADCPVTVGDLIDCYKAAKTDACAAFAQDGACGPLFSQAASCF